MAITSALRTESYFKTVDSFDDLLGGKTYTMLGENVMVYKDKKGKYVVFTIDPKATYTVDDFVELPEGAPFELLNGKLIYMSSPKDYHQEVSLNLAAALHYFVKSNKLGVIREAPYDVHLDGKNIFQPDILF
ncbi:MAG: Uma2 family endonuclease, partial [Saprospiraceae bacterium]